MSTELAKAYVQIVPSADGISSGIQSALGDGEAMGKSFGSKIGGGISTAFKAGGVAFAALGTAAAGAGKAMLDNAKKTAEAGDFIDKTSQKIGFSTKSFQEWDYVMSLAGTSMADCTTGMKTLTNSFDDAVGGSEKAEEKFTRLGLSLEDIQGLTQEELFAKVVEGLQNMDDGMERAAAANDLFGKSGQNLMPLFNQTNEATKDLISQANEYGLVMGDDAVKASAAFKDSMTKLSGTLGGLKNRLGAEMLPALTQVTDGISDLIIGKDGAEKKIADGIETIIKNISTTIPQFTSVVVRVAEAVLKIAPDVIKSLAKGIMQEAPSLLKTALDVIMELVTGLINALPELIPAAVDIVLNLVTDILNNLPKIVEGGIKLITGLIEGLTKAIPKIIEAMPQIINAIWKTIINTDWLDLGIQIIKGIVKGLLSCGSAIKEAASKIKDSIVDSIKNKFSIHSPSKLMHDEVGVMLARGISGGFVDEADNVNKTMTDAIQSEFNVDATAGLNASLSSSSMTRNASATDNLLLQMLQKLDDLANMQIVLDSGALVGSTATQMNAALGRISRREAYR